MIYEKVAKLCADRGMSIRALELELKMGNGTEYVISSYPVQVQGLDVLFVAGIVLVLGFVAAWYPTRRLGVRGLEDSKI